MTLVKRAARRAELVFVRRRLESSRFLTGSCFVRNMTGQLFIFSVSPIAWHIFRRREIDAWKAFERAWARMSSSTLRWTVTSTDVYIRTTHRRCDESKTFCRSTTESAHRQQLGQTQIENPIAALLRSLHVSAFSQSVGDYDSGGISPEVHAT